MNLKVVSGKESRQFKRIPTDRPIKLINKNESFNLKMINLSQGGAGVLSGVQFETGEELQVEIKIPFMYQLTRLKMDATVRYSTPIRGQFLIGIRFEDPSKHQQLVLEKFINHRFQFKL